MSPGTTPRHAGARPPCSRGRRRRPLEPENPRRPARPVRLEPDQVVLVLGGTVPGNGPSVAGSLDQLAEEQAGARAVPRGLLSSVTAWPVAPDAVRQRSGLPAGDRGPGIAYRGRRHGSCGENVGGRSPRRPMSPLMVAFGPAEAQALNLAARPLWLELYELGGTVSARQRPRGHPGRARLRGRRPRSSLFDALAWPRAQHPDRWWQGALVRSRSSGKGLRGRGTARWAASTPVRWAMATPRRRRLKHEI